MIIKIVMGPEGGGHGQISKFNEVQRIEMIFSGKMSYFFPETNFLV